MWMAAMGVHKCCVDYDHVKQMHFPRVPYTHRRIHRSRSSCVEEEIYLRLNRHVVKVILMSNLMMSSEIVEVRSDQTQKGSVLALQKIEGTGT